MLFLFSITVIAAESIFAASPRFNEPDEMFDIILQEERFAADWAAQTGQESANTWISVETSVTFNTLSSITTASE